MSRRIGARACRLGVLALAVVSAGCGADATNPPAIATPVVAPPSPAALVAISPQQQDTTVASILSIAVEVHDKSGGPIADQPVDFLGPSTFGTTFKASVRTSSDGRAYTTWIVPTTPGSYSLAASTPNGLTVSFAVRVHAGPPSALSPTMSVEQIGAPGETLQPGVVVQDGWKNSLAGVSVSFTVGGVAGGSVQRATAVTDGAGLATAGVWTVGTEFGTYTLDATVQSAGETAPHVTFTVNVRVPFMASTVAAGEQAGCATAMASPNATYCWGRGFDPARPGDSASQTLAPTAIRTAPAFAALTVGLLHACGLTADGTAYCWGSNALGQAGASSTIAASAEAVRVQTRLRFTQIAAGRASTCGLAVDGNAWCWGDNAFGQLGDSTYAGTPTPVAVAGDHRFTQLAVGDQHVCGMVAAAEVWCWGRNDAGQLGAAVAHTCTTISQNYNGGYLNVDTSVVSCSAVPVRVQVAPALVSLSASLDTCGLSVDGNVICWGAGGAQAAFYLAPAPLRQVVASGTGVCALDLSGQAYCSGTYALERAGPSVPVRLLTAGLAHQCVIASSSRIAYCWGTNGYGQLGNGTTTSSTLAVPVVSP